jgi:hypothetical protein
MEEYLVKRNLLAKKICKDVNDLFTVLSKTLLKQDTKQFHELRFRWKYIDDGYGGFINIYDTSKSRWRNKHSLLVYNIEREDSFYHLLQNGDQRIFEAITEMNAFLLPKLTSYDKSIEAMEYNFASCNLITQDIIKAYRDIK